MYERKVFYFTSMVFKVDENDRIFFWKVKLKNQQQMQHKTEIFLVQNVEKHEKTKE